MEKIREELVKMPVIEERRVTLSGASLVMTLPKEWCEEHEIKGGDKILVKANGRLEVMVKSDDNIKLMNQEVMAVRNQLAHTQTSPIALDKKTGAPAK